ncbi:hypothetical protein [Neolewinella sp.]|uniref:hypothetical protein n=1 Tax=Neolewinella sp. TaxID=2993543 RepID=UPI003B5176B0
MRLLLLLTLCAGWVACAEKSELTLATADNDFIEGTLDGQPFHYASGSFYGSGMDYQLPYSTTGGGGETGTTTQWGGLLVSRIDASFTRAVSLALPGVPLHTYSMPTADLQGTLTQGTLAADSYPGCPHIDSSGLDIVAVSLRIASWDGDQLIGEFVSADPNREVTGSFHLLIARP